MKTYRFPKDQLTPIMSHVDAYQITILSLAPNNNDYIMELDCDNLPLGEYEHLNTEFALEEII